MIARIKDIYERGCRSLRDDGTKETVKKAGRILRNKILPVKSNKAAHDFQDILFVNGCHLPHPQRYRVDHQMEQLMAAGFSCSKVDYTCVTPGLSKYFRAIIIYRCPITPEVKQLIQNAKANNKPVFYDIDDLVFDTKYTESLDVLNSMNEKEKMVYQKGVSLMGETLELCDYGIASTKRLQIEMNKKLKEVFINRNVASEEMIKYSQIALETVHRNNGKIIMGYLSGSITHNKDFELIQPIIIELLQKYDSLYLEIVGLLDLPTEMRKVKHKIITKSFASWRKLPQMIRELDINLAPLEDTIFNEAKSENKWTEAALVKVPTVASDVGAFHDCIEHGKTGFLCRTKEEWKNTLESLINGSELRTIIGEQAYEKAMTYHTTLTTATSLRDFIISKLPKNICFVLPSTNISGGIMVAIKHCQILKKNGYDVTILNAQLNEENVIDNSEEINVISALNTNFEAYVDIMVATMWLTLEFVTLYKNCQNKKYLVQGYETDFYHYGQPERIKAMATYNTLYPVQYITISRWCQGWLEEKFQRTVKYAPNGIDLRIFPYVKRKKNSKIQILIEGNSKDFYKNVDESFKIVEKLDKTKYEIHYLSYEKEPKDWYHIDHFYHKVPHDEVGKIYQKCDLLIKTSILESFSYPPLEMMATGGLCIAIQNEGNKEFMKDMENCIIYSQGNIDEAVEKIEHLMSDQKLQEKLRKNGLKAAEKRDWKKIEQDIINLYQ